jgi:lipoyl-dependent peroxiredoxin
MPVRKANAIWEGNLKEGKGKMALGSGAFEGPFSFGTRFEEAKGTNPEELLGAAHAGCFSMALSHGLAEAGFTPTRVETSARVHLTKDSSGFRIATIELACEAEVPGIDEKKFQELAEGTKKNCPVSKALTGPEIKLQAKLVRR